MINLLASGVFFSGFIKDTLCLPRPLSPPLQRITRSHSAALEYGFPSTHSTNAVSVVAYALYSLNTTTRSMQPLLNILLQFLIYAYLLSIVIGRLYCGMHGFFDVVVGSVLGGILTVLQCMFEESFNTWILRGSAVNLVVFSLVILVLVRVHPEPADDCPCYDDSVSFAGVIMGVQAGNWHFAQSGYASNAPVFGAVPFSLKEAGLIKAALRLLLGVVVVFAWRAIAKPTLLVILPPIFRVVEQLGLTLPRAFYLRASYVLSLFSIVHLLMQSKRQYKTVPDLRQDDNIIPQASEIPAMFASLSHPRKRTVSIGPQSQADVYEAIAVRQRNRRASEAAEQKLYAFVRTRHADIQDNGVPSEDGSTSNMTVEESQPTTTALVGSDGEEDEELFRRLQVPRVRYDVEVITRLVVYFGRSSGNSGTVSFMLMAMVQTGIAWFSTEFNPILFEHVGLGMGIRP